MFFKGDSDYISRVFFDLSFFIVVGVVLFNVITGLMVDGFGALRDEANERADVKHSCIFIRFYIAALCELAVHILERLLYL